MLLGIDVGGTFTDAVILEQGEIAAQAKRATTHDDVLHCVLAALDAVLKPELAEKLERVVISSTIVTNALTEGRLDEVFLAVIAGPGMNIAGHLPVIPCYLQGYVNHRGKITAQLDLLKLLQQHGKGVAAVSGKFSVRNPQLEYQAEHELKKCGYKKIFLGSGLSGELNFVRRTNSAYFAAQVYELFAHFCERIREALAERGVHAPVHILKADGGTLPLAVALEQPVEAVFTGPAASVLGIEALAAPTVNSISLDVGGTTTDIAFWENGLPLMAKRGAVINGYPTAVRAFHMRSVGIGGDSRIHKTADGYTVGPEREGPAAAVGGEVATLSDALIVAGYVSFGDTARSLAALEKFGSEPQLEAKRIIASAVGIIRGTIETMLDEWAKQPVYTVDDVIRGTEFVPAQLIGVGGGAPGLIKALGEAMELPVEIPAGAMVANAIGAAVARPTLSAGLRADTTEGFYIIPESGRRERLPKRFTQKVAEELLSSWLREQTADWQLPDAETELVSCEHFRTVHGYYDTGDIYNLRMQLRPGILYKVQGREVSF
ncbi:hydantoinase/oxoprolinase family protein [uncultured Phascolarctobacterium sp.]|jgi:N-methylhydantoinase A/oxoprolinase/acetone carboxylase beta subunit|uniref:hydantoinase/oxoprolinase family protein n=1 Tax=uncultured Phascolarctobacterium sp. TaxID=512296 RepID=UPI0025F0FCBA|nr:hydantoinase/oxoprolinase family protein [uncultured Phascolarctobacterium sp.]